MSSSRLIDISRPLSNGFPHWPEDPAFQRTVSSINVGQRQLSVSALTMSAHSGTHLDAPSHLADPDEDPAPTVTDLDLNLLVGPATVLDARGGAEVTAEQIRALPGCPARVLLRTDNSDRPYSMERFVALSADAAQALVSRACLLVGIDGPSMDPPEALDLPAHQALLAAGTVLLEGLDLRHAEPGVDYELICLPLALRGADGAPARAVLRAQ